ncbi:hypothetical protein BGX31_005431 [Mortierella sp. GBA43]|nr:hypothetical protein BGX31_005431 [Mortierella sp. GBA43]
MGSYLSTESTPDHEHLRKELCQQSQDAYRSGNGARAKELSLEADLWRVRMDRYDDEAKELIFKANNASRPQSEIDLHGLKVKEAIEKTRERLATFVKKREPNLIIIVGQGKHSLNGPRIKPAIIELVKEYRIKATPNKPNPGCIYVEPLQEGEGFDFTWIRIG